MHRTIIFTLLVLSLLWLNIYLGDRESSLLVIDEERGKVLLSLPIKRGESFIIGYKHSVEKTEVKEIYRFENKNKITLKAMRYSSLGAGLPSVVDGKENFHLENAFQNKSRFYLGNINKEFKEISLRVGWETGHFIEYKGRVFFLKEFASPGSLISIRKEHLFP